MSPPKKDPRRPGASVRRGQMEATLEAFNREMAQKVAVSIHNYHMEQVEPRLKELEWRTTVWYKKLWVWSRLLWRRIHPPTITPLFEVGEKVQTTELGAKHFGGTHQAGVVVASTESRVTVKIDGRGDEPELWSQSVWCLRAEKE